MQMRFQKEKIIGGDVVKLLLGDGMAFENVIDGPEHVVGGHVVVGVQTRTTELGVESFDGFVEVIGRWFREIHC